MGMAKLTTDGGATALDDGAQRMAVCSLAHAPKPLRHAVS
jgi:hypothetical protein